MSTKIIFIFAEMEEQENQRQEEITRRDAPKDSSCEEGVPMLPTTEAAILLELEDYIAKSSMVTGRETSKLSIVTGSAASQAASKMLGLSQKKKIKRERKNPGKSALKKKRRSPPR